MRAVNLIPSDERRARGAAGRSGGGAYIVLVGLALLVGMVGALTMSGRTVVDRKAELAKVTAEASAAEAKAAGLAAYTKFAALREARVQTVSSLVASRFDWSRVLHEIARVVPADAWLTGMTGSRPATASGSAAPTAPSFQVTGCTTGHKSVARMMVRMRLIDGVEKVTLSSSDQVAGTDGAASGGGAGDGCVTRAKKGAQFALTVHFNAPAAPAAAAPAATGAANAGTPASTPTAPATPSAAPASTGGTP